MSESKQYIRLRFSKQGDIRFTSHHDMMRLFERAVRRADLPVAMSQGWNPRPKISLPAPLPAGIAGSNEAADIELARWLRPAEIEARLAAVMSPGLEVKSVGVIAPHPNRRPREFSYRIPLSEGHPLTEDRIQELLRSAQLFVLREKKGRSSRVDVRNSIKNLPLQNNALLLLVEFSDGATARPEEVLDALGCQPHSHYPRSGIERTRVDLSSSLQRT